jgi:tetratricopeptide (TPR) repeat protein
MTEANVPAKPALTDLLRTRGVIELLLAAVAFIVYAGALAFGFVYDDLSQVVGNPALRSWSYLAGDFTHHVWYLVNPHLAANYYRPVFVIWLRLNYFLFGLSPAGWHFTTIALHITASVQVFWLGQRLLKDRFAAACAALLFAVHPIHVESVAWISGVTDPLMTVTMLASALAFLRWQQTRSAATYAVAIIFAALAFLSKEPAIVLPILLTVSAWAALPADAKLQKRNLLGLVPFYALAIGYLALRQFVLKGFSHNVPTASVGEMVFTWPSAVVFYLRQLLLPHQLSLFHDFDWVKSPFTGSFLIPVLILAVLAIIAFNGVYSSRERRTLIAALAWFIIPFAPVMYLRAFSEGELVHDRYAYLPSVGLVLLVVIIARAVLQRSDSRVRFSRGLVLVTSVAMVFAGLTFYNQIDWANETLLFTHAAEVAPRNFNATLNLGSVYAERGDAESLTIARTLYSKVVANHPDSAAANYDLGHVEFQLRDYDNTEMHLKRAVKAEPNRSSWWMQLAGIELRQGKFSEAETSAREALRLSPREPGYHAALGAILLDAGKLDQAEQAFKNEISLSPHDEGARQALAKILALRQRSTSSQNGVPQR